MDFTTIQIAENFWALEQQGVRAFLFEGPDRALLVDTGFRGDLKTPVEAITTKPITLITTHSDGDHIGCDKQFPDQYLHPAEFDCYERRNKTRTHAKPMWEGDVFDIGTYKLEVVLTPGHTPGSCCLLEREKGFILGGDTIQAHFIYMHGDGRNVPAFLHTMKKMDAMRRAGVFHTVYASHGKLELSADITEELLTLAETVLDGTAEPVGPAPDHFPETVKTFSYGQVSMYTEKH